MGSLRALFGVTFAHPIGMGGFQGTLAGRRDKTFGMAGLLRRRDPLDARRHGVISRGEQTHRLEHVGIGSSASSRSCGDCAGLVRVSWQKKKWGMARGLFDQPIHSVGISAWARNILQAPTGMAYGLSGDDGGDVVARPVWA